MPLYYRIIPGSIKNVNTLQDSLANLSFVEKVFSHYVMDKVIKETPVRGVKAEYSEEAIAGHKRNPAVHGLRFAGGSERDENSPHGKRPWQYVCTMNFAMDKPRR